MLLHHFSQKVQQSAASTAVVSVVAMEILCAEFSSTCPASSKPVDILSETRRNSLVSFPGSPSRETPSAFPEFIAFPKFPRWWPKCCWFYWQFQQYSVHRSQLKLWINFSAKDIQIIGRFWWADYFKHHDRFNLLALYLVQSIDYNSDSLSVSALETVFFSLLVLPSNLVSRTLFPAFVARCFLHFIC